MMPCSLDLDSDELLDLFLSDSEPAPIRAEYSPIRGSLPVGPRCGCHETPDDAFPTLILDHPDPEYG